ARARKQLGCLLLQPLDARTDRNEAALRLAFRTLPGRRHRIAAVMTDQPPLEAVIDQPGVAVRARHPIAAGIAQRQRRKAATVEEEQRLLVALDREPHLLGEPRRDEAAARRAFAAKIDRLNRRQMLAAETLGQMQ